MTKKEEINKSIIIIGIAAFAIIAFAIIASINFFTPKSHAQVGQFNKVADTKLNKLYATSLKAVDKDKWSKHWNNQKPAVSKDTQFAKFEKFANKDMPDDWKFASKSQFKTGFTLGLAKDKYAGKFSEANFGCKDDFLNFDFEKGVRS